MLLKPNCCERGKKALVRDGETWILRCIAEGQMPVEFCPFCGKKLPDKSQFAMPEGTREYQEGAERAWNLYGKQWPNQKELLKDGAYEKHCLNRLEYQWAVWDYLGLEGDIDKIFLPEICILVRMMENGSSDCNPDDLRKYKRYLRAVYESWSFPEDEFDRCIRRLVELTKE